MTGRPSLTLHSAEQLLARARRERAPERAVERLRLLLEYPPELLGECAEMIEDKAEQVNARGAGSRKATVLRAVARTLRDVAEVATDE